MTNRQDNYIFKRQIDIGSSSIVWDAEEKHTKQPVVIKVVINCLQSELETFFIYNEICILFALKNSHLNIISIKEVFIYNKNVYLVFNKMETNLYLLLKSNECITDNHVKHIMYILLKTSSYLHQHNIIHRDIKPGNILVSPPFNFKICDFGLSCYNNSVNPNNVSVLSEHVVTRWYRAPEICLRGKYSYPIDIWSIGCIFAELLSIIRSTPDEPHKESTILFKGTSCSSLSPDPSQKMTNGDQLVKIMQVLGPITDDDIQVMKIPVSSNKILKDAQLIVNSMKKTSLEEIFKDVPMSALDLLQQMLTINPNKRITADDALSHSYFDDIIQTHYTYDIDHPNRDILRKIEQVEDIPYNVLCEELDKLISSNT